MRVPTLGRMGLSPRRKGGVAILVEGQRMTDKVCSSGRRYQDGENRAEFLKTVQKVDVDYVVGLGLGLLPCVLVNKSRWT